MQRGPDRTYFWSVVSTYAPEYVAQLRARVLDRMSRRNGRVVAQINQDFVAGTRLLKALPERFMVRRQKKSRVQKAELKAELHDSSLSLGDDH